MGGIRIFYSSSLLWDSDLSSIRVKVLLTLTLGSRNRFLPESPLIPDDGLIHQKIPEILIDIS
jgi:hypothetical protein